MPTACILLADGFEEIEAVTVADVLRRAEVETVLVGTKAGTVTGAHGIELRADAVLPEVTDRAWDLVALPGGMPGATNLRDDPAVCALLRRQVAEGRIAGAICAAPIALAAAGVLEGRRATCYPGFRDQLGGATYEKAPVVTDGPVITSRGPGTALSFALTLTAELCGTAVRDRLAAAMLVTS